MRLAGQRLIELLIGAAEGIALRDLPQKHGYPFNLAELARQAKEGLREEGVSLTPVSFRQAADTQAARWASMSHDWAGIGEPDYRAFMDGRVDDFLRSAREVREEATRAEAALEADMLLRRQAQAAVPLVDPYEDTPF